MVRAPARFDARGRPDAKASPGLPRRAGLLAAFDLARDEVGLRRRRRSTTSLFQTRRVEAIANRARHQREHRLRTKLQIQVSNSDARQASAVPRRDAPEFFMKSIRPEKQRAQGMPGARCTRGLACEIKQSTRA